MEVTFQDGSTYRGWRAWVFLPILLPYILVAVITGLVLFAARLITGRDRVLGYEYEGAGTWKRVD